MPPESQQCFFLTKSLRVSLVSKRLWRDLCVGCSHDSFRLSMPFYRSENELLLELAAVGNLFPSVVGC